jgi:hypothetical protein
MATASAGSPRIDRYRFRTRSADADWDFFPLGCWGPGYRVNEAQRHRLMHSGWGITLLALLAAQFLIGAAVIAAIGHIDYNNFWNAVLLLLAMVTPLSLFVTARWLCVWLACHQQNGRLRCTRCRPFVRWRMGGTRFSQQSSC